MFENSPLLKSILWYATIALIVFLIFSLQVRYSPELNLIFMFMYIMVFLFISEVVSHSAGKYTGLIAVFLQFIKSFLETDEKNQLLLNSAILTIFFTFYILVKKLRRKKLEKTTAREKYFRTLIDVNPHPIILKDEKGKILLSSESIKDLLGLDENIENGKELIDFVHIDDVTKYRSFLNTITKSPGVSMSEEFRLKFKENYIWVKNHAINFLDNKDIKAIVSSLQNITLQKDIDKQKAFLLQNEQKARSQAEKAVRDRDEFLSIASHELKTPLTTILLQLQATLRKISTQSLADFSGTELLNSLQIAEKQSQNLSTLIKDLLNVSLTSTNRLSLIKQKVNLVELSELLYKKYDAEIKLSESSVELITKSQHINGYWDPIRIEQAMTNIFLNALKYAKGKKITITCELSNQLAIFKVADKGQGIEPEKINDIFKPFNHNDNKRGLGVGLFISKQIAIAHGGDIEVESTVGKGSEFTLKLPITQNH